jgi:hypothetical protein
MRRRLQGSKSRVWRQVLLFPSSIKNRLGSKLNISVTT